MKALSAGMLLFSVVALTACSAQPVVVEPELPPNLLATKTTYRGTLPCADCAGIQNTLVLYQNEKGETSRYQLMQKYIGGEALTVIERGDWQTRQDTLGQIIVLSPNDPDASQQYLHNAANAIELLGRDGKPAESGLNYTLMKAD